MSANDRIDRLERVVVGLQARREEIITVLMWEICKSAVDAAAEFDRTMLFIEATIAAYRKLDREEGGWNTISGIFARVRRAAIGKCTYCTYCRTRPGASCSIAPSSLLLSSLNNHHLHPPSTALPTSLPTPPSSGIMLCLGPFNYPFNETYATLIPALLAGNVVIMKVPNHHH